jgi:hypothetical protein
MKSDAETAAPAPSLPNITTCLIHQYPGQSRAAFLVRIIHTAAHRESRAAPRAGAIPPWPSPPIARNLLRSLSPALAGKVAYPALSSVRSLGLIRISLLFDTGAFRCAGFRIAPAFPSCEPDREASPGGCGHRDVEVTFRPGPWEPPPLERSGWRPTR